MEYSNVQMGTGLGDFLENPRTSAKHYTIVIVMSQRSFVRFFNILTSVIL